MPLSWGSLFKSAYWTLAIGGGIYAIILGLLTNPTIQRNALYANRIHTHGWWHNISEPQQFGFAKNQITTFYLPTVDGEQLYCWHILPLRLYIEHEDVLARTPTGPVDDFTETLAYDLLRKDPESRVVVNFHGNAGHIAQGYRTQTYQSITAIPNTHVFTCDYRGFGLSTGSPTEPGLITDAITLVSYILSDLAQPSSRIVLLGQSLGTGVASATTLFFLDPSSTLIPSTVPDPTITTLAKTPLTFAATVLVSPFSSIPTLLLNYRIAGLFPVLSPLRPYPKILSFLTSRIVDTWPSLTRLQAAFQTSSSLKLPLNVQIIHARNDADISFTNGEAIFEGVAKAMKEGGVEQSEVEERSSVLGEGVRRGAWAYRRCEDEWVERGRRRNVELEITKYGGHNQIVASAAVYKAVERSFIDAASLGQGQ